MNSHNSDCSVTEDLLRLYELALSIGKELDLSGLCRNFLRILISRYNLTGASLWWQETNKDELEPLALLPQTPNNETPLSIIVQARDLTGNKAPTITTLKGQTFAIYPFSRNGVLLMQTAHQDLFSPRMLNGLRPVLGTLTTAIQGRMAHAQLDKSRQTLNQQRSFLKTLIQTLPDLIWLKDQDGVYLACNPRFELFFGASESEIIGKTDYDFVEQSLADSFREHDFKAMHKGAPSVNEEQITFASDGHLELLETTKTPMFDEQGQLIGVLGIGHDITDRRNAEEKLKISESSFRSLFDNLQEGVYVQDRYGHFIMVNEGAAHMYGRPREWFTGKSPKDLAAPAFSDPGTLESRYTKALSGEPQTFEIWNMKPDGTAFPNEVRLTLGSWFGESVIFAIAVDITKRKQQEDQIIRQAHYDTLTDLPNRFLTMDRLSQLIKEANRDKTQVAILFLDLDDFKKVNDTLGHDTGDKLLKQAALRLQASVRTGDTVGRLGGDEFIVLLGNMNNASDARPVAESLLKQFRESFHIDGREMILTVSIGISIYPDDSNKPLELLSKSDSAMYHSKAQGRNTYSYFTDEMNRDVSRRLLLEGLMAGALEQGEFQVYYQPKVDLQSGKIAGVEALLRWHNPTLGEVEPKEFIPIAEQSGLIVPLGQFVITESLKISPILQRQLGRPLSIAVNLSPRQFRDPNLLAFIKQVLHHPSMRNTTFELEITEGVLMSGQSYIKDTLLAISRLGVNLAMDDFGTGYSSLSYLRNYPFNVLKIDREFVKGICTSNADRELVNAAIAMAHGLGLKVVAEGIETQEQCNLLTTQGCDFGQGYLFSRPLTTQMVSQLLVVESGSE
jgi:diguanylate cyclase (GGDEF)-like protein/PAS domain S-box-containing protein